MWFTLIQKQKSEFVWNQTVA